MNITTKTGWVGFLVALSALNIPNAQAAVNQACVTNSTPQAIETRIAKIVATLKVRENQLGESPHIPTDEEIALGWANGGGGGRGFVNTRRGGWGDGYRGGFANINPWRNGWRDGGGFWNQRW